MSNHRTGGTLVGAAVGVALAFATPGPALSSVIYVNGANAEPGDGMSWASAYQQLDTALSTALDGDQVWVATGTYIPGGVPGDRTRRFTITRSIELYGGFAGGESSIDDRDIEAYPTILSGDLEADDETTGDRTDNAHRILEASAGISVVIDGMLFRGGRADHAEEAALRNGGAVATLAVDAVMRHCTFDDNAAANQGGAIYSTDSVLELVDCAFFGNEAANGGGVYCVAPPPGATSEALTMLDCRFIGNAGGAGAGVSALYGNASIVGCVFEENAAGGAGGGLRAVGTRISIEGCEFTANSATGAGGACAIWASTTHETSIRHSLVRGNSAQGGGGIFVIGGSQPSTVTISDVDVLENAASILGGGVLIDVAESRISNCRFFANDGGYWGGGLLLASAYDNSALIVNSLFADNVADGSGGGAHVRLDSATTSFASFVNCTFARNCGAGVASFEATVELDNCILWGNTLAQVFIDTDDGPPPPSGAPSVASFTLRHCDVQGGWSGAGSDNIDLEPLFVQPSQRDYRLAFGSPCLDVGDNSALPTGIDTDLAGRPRVENGTVDLGAYEGSFEPQSTIVQGEIAPGSVGLIGDFGCELDAEDINESSYVFFRNESETEAATLEITEQPDTPNSGAGGFSELGNVVTVDVSLAAGSYSQLVTVAFDADDLAGEDPLDLDLTTFDSATDDWVLAASTNVRMHPGDSDSLGERFVTTGENFAAVGELGDYGVFWNPQTEAGLVWARVDHDGEFAVGDALCPGDLTPIERTDGVVDHLDLIALFSAWGQADSVADIHPDRGDGMVDIDDLLRLLANWGPCP